MNENLLALLQRIKQSADMAEAIIAIREMLK